MLRGNLFEELHPFLAGRDPGYGGDEASPNP
jgi:hypothetical protein